ncbi:glycosyltransferase family 4 protein [Haliovirga abyssi]|uniref:Glycosyl transferase family 1 n=1 Tax=Haliovirga abyssi TaxID=2996794 RepID=A0AAU9DV47_9FUSO|nr:glycosyltransferase family 4 protein [Haliovirga abyssi]BDU49981.1 glycosyl transferase family 1 [Haliovirga abyssi]
MRIGIFTDTYKPNINGVVTSIEIKKRELEKLGHKVYIIAPTEPNYEEIDPDIIRLKSFKLVFQPEYRLTYPPKLETLKRIEVLNLDIIHAETPFSLGLLGAYIAKKTGKPLVHTYHTLFPEYVHYLKLPKTGTKKMAESISAIYCNACNYIISPSNQVKEKLLEYGVKRNISVIPTGIDVCKFKNSKKIGIRKKLNIKEEEKVLIFVGRLGEEKNIDFLLDSLKLLKEKDDNIKLMLVGDGPYREKLKNRCKELNIEENVVFAGYVQRENIAEYYRESDIFVFSSLTETQGLVVLEAMATGIPVVAVKASGVEDMVENGVSGFLTSLDEKEFVEKIDLILNDEELYKEISKKSMEEAEKFTPENTFAKMADIYIELSEKRRMKIIKKALKLRRSRAARIIARFGKRRRKNKK